MAGLMVLDGPRHTALWGTEDWVVSAREGSASKITAGWRAGETLDAVYPDFPLLFKVISAQSRLSVQVHPDERSVVLTGGEPKTEMWCALSPGPIYAGLKAGTAAGDVEKAVASGEFEKLLVRHDAVPGDVFYIPGGMIHAIGDGIELFEVQQSSDTTFRLYDWGRVDCSGRPRKLHVREALQAANLPLPPPDACRDLDTPFFSFSRMRLDGEANLEAGDGFLAAFAADGSVSADGLHVDRRTCFLLPPGSACTVKGDGVTLMITGVPVPDGRSTQG